MLTQLQITSAKPKAKPYRLADGQGLVLIVYAREELVAEIGFAFLCAALGIAPTVRHSDYIGAWLEVLRADSRAIFRAASAASRVAEWLLGRRSEAAAAGDLGFGGRVRA